MAWRWRWRWREVTLVPHRKHGDREARRQGDREGEAVTRIDSEVFNGKAGYIC